MSDMTHSEAEEQLAVAGDQEDAEEARTAERDESEAPAEEQAMHAATTGDVIEEVAAEDEAIVEAAEDEVVEEVEEDVAEALAEVAAEELAEEIVEEIVEEAALETLDEVVAEELAAEEAEDAAVAAEPTPAAETALVLDATKDGADVELGGWGEDEEDEEPVPVESPYDRPGRWYVVHTYSGYENKVRSNLGNVVASRGIEDRVFEVVIPMEDVIEFKGGRKVVVQKKVFPGYLLVRMALDDDSWYVVRNTPGVTGFVGNGARPTPLSRKEVENILGTGEKEEVGVEKRARPRLDFEEGEQVRVTTGPFADFNGVISDIDVARSKLTVLVNIFGRETPVELELGQVAKL